MSLIVDRPYPVDYIHPNGTEAKIDFIWGRSDDDVPVGVKVLVKDGANDLQLVRDHGTWKSYEEARRYGMELAAKWCERL